MQFVKSVIVSIFGKQKIPYSLNAKKSKEQKENTDIMSITLPFNIYVHLSWKERDRVKEKKIIHGRNTMALEEGSYFFHLYNMVQYELYLREEQRSSCMHDFYQKHPTIMDNI